MQFIEPIDEICYHFKLDINNGDLPSIRNLLDFAAMDIEHTRTSRLGFDSSTPTMEYSGSAMLDNFFEFGLTHAYKFETCVSLEESRCFQI